MSNTNDIVILGGGAAGCATAYYLGRAGIKSTIVEREGIGNQASGFSAGGVNPLHGIPGPIADLAIQSYRLHRELWPELERLTGRNCRERIIESALVALREAEVPDIMALQAGFDVAEGFEARWLDGAELIRREPRLSPIVLGGLYVRGNGVVDSHEYTLRLAEAAQHYGATVRAGEVRELEQTGRRVSRVVLEDGVIPCERVVIALGPWSGLVGEWLDLRLPVEPLKGEIARMELAGPPLAFDVNGPDVSLFGRDGQIWCASTAELRGFDREPSTSAYDSLVGNAIKLMPAIAEAKLARQTACLRPLTPDELPIVGQVPGWEGLYVATGGAKKGILLSTGMGKAVADLIATGSTSIAIGTSAPERFARATA